MLFTRRALAPGSAEDAREEVMEAMDVPEKVFSAEQSAESESARRRAAGGGERIRGDVVG
jgi:hypothetical protein